MNDIARNIKTLRKRAGLTQDDLAEKLYVTRQAVSNWENNKTQPDIDTLLSLSKALNCDISELLYGEKPSEPLYEKMQKKYTVLSVISLIVICASLPLENFTDAYERLYFNTNYRLIYIAYMLLAVFAAAVLCLSVISLFANISIKNKSARRAIMLVFCVSVFAIVLFWVAFFADTRGLLGACGEIVIGMIDHPIVLYIPSAIAGASLFMAQNNSNEKAHS